MVKVYKVTPKRIKRTNGTVLMPEMTIIVSTMQHISDPSYNGANPTLCNDNQLKNTGNNSN